MDMMEIRRSILMTKKSIIPSLYRQVKYIKAKSSAYIATEYVPTRYDEIEAEFSIGSVNDFQCLFSAGTDTYQLVLLLMASDRTSYYRYFNSTAQGNRLYLQTDRLYKLLSTANGTLILNDYSISYSFGSEIDGNNKTMYIFRRRNGTSQMLGKLKSFRITNNGELKLNLIPCIRISDNKAGVYDTVSETFMSSASASEEFTPSTLDT